MMERLRDATNAHDARRLASLFARDYQSAQPVHPTRRFGGSAQVVENWSSVFEGVPDFRSELVASSVDGDTEWGEWSWQGHHVEATSTPPCRSCTSLRRGRRSVHLPEYGPSR